MRFIKTLMLNRAAVLFACFALFAIYFVFHTVYKAQAGLGSKSVGVFPWLSDSWNSNDTVPVPNDTIANDTLDDAVDFQHERIPGRPLNDHFLQKAPPFVQAILDPDDAAFPRLECKSQLDEQYHYLQRSDARGNSFRTKYFFAIDLYECIHLLPRLIGSIVEVARFLGPEHCTLSIVEGRSGDGTYEVLHSLYEEFDRIGLRYHLLSSDVNPTEGDRIEGLATLRNLALQPLLRVPASVGDTTVVFLNDVAICTEDILELIHQRIYQRAHMTCAMDWTFVRTNPTFYDVWIARDMKGDSFFRIPLDGSWDFSEDLFPENRELSGAVHTGSPFQVFSCWNGAAVFTAQVLRHVEFRKNIEGECYQGEPQLFCKEMWYHGFKRIAVIPSVNIEYNDEAAKRIKELKGYVSRWTEKEDPQPIHWQDNPPESVRCMHGWHNQYMVPWDEALADNGIFPGRKLRET